MRRLRMTAMPVYYGNYEILIKDPLLTIFIFFVSFKES